jgi:hypothetical protein
MKGARVAAATGVVNFPVVGPVAVVAIGPVETDADDEDEDEDDGASMLPSTEQLLARRDAGKGGMRAGSGCCCAAAVA